ncbi:hypothetical protein CFIO01_05095 [Colletotrichum fioriniae PJ7]|uniref:Uncharacterized protein n=1 Tax=Colletotrichum fioriniae PJ7 TaxID=1445577 RepID=A0A010R9D7_9PEZI|nr:hypothetical protein CFIO01_05095 [Colletotrichum fioriniae PJ7]
MIPLLLVSFFFTWATYAAQVPRYVAAVHIDRANMTMTAVAVQSGAIFRRQSRDPNTCGYVANKPFTCPNNGSCRSSRDKKHIGCCNEDASSCNIYTACYPGSEQSGASEETISILRCGAIRSHNNTDEHSEDLTDELQSSAFNGGILFCIFHFLCHRAHNKIISSSANIIFFGGHCYAYRKSNFRCPSFFIQSTSRSNPFCVGQAASTAARKRRHARYY